MIRSKVLWVIIFFLLQAVWISACAVSSSATKTNTPAMPSSAPCGEQVYSRESEEGIMEDYFEYIRFYDAETGEGFVQDQSGTYFLSTAQHIAVGYKTAFPNHMRVCIQEYDEEGNVVFDDTINTDGQGSWALQSLTSGEYVIRVIVKNMIIDSFVFHVSE